MPILTVRHTTTYRYRQPVGFGEHRMMFRPRDSHDQKLLEEQLVIVPEPASIRWVHDVFGNCVAIARFVERAAMLRFQSTIRIEHAAGNAIDFSMEEYAETMPFTYSSEDMPDLLRSIERQYLDPEHELDRWSRQFLWRSRPTPTRELLATMTYFISTNFKYVSRNESGIQAPLTTLSLASGTCRDFAVLMMEAVRSLGLAARFVSGYLFVRDGADGPRLGGGATHAWVQVYVPGAGWVEFDPTNGIVGNLDLIRVAVTRDPRHAIPLAGTFIGFPADFLGMDVDVSVTTDARRHAMPELISEPLKEGAG